MAQARLAKLSAPRTSNWLARARLHQLLDRLSLQAAVWIAAGPGSGKSTLAACWAAARGPRTLWLRADADDADPGAAFGYFAELARATTRRRAFLPAYQPQDAPRLEAFARGFFRAFFAAIPAAATLVIDDAHTAAGSDFDRLLAAAIREAPPDIALVLISRQDPPGPLLDEVARGGLALLEEEALAFSADEAAELLAGRIDRATAQRLHSQAGGWAAGLVLLAQQPALDMNPAAIARERLDAFFAERVLAPLATAERLTLAAAALLPEVDVAALRAMGLPETAGETLEGLRRVHTFVARLDRQPPSWRLHDLLRSALSERFDRTGDAAWRDRVQRAAARIAAERGLVRDAAQLLLRSGDAPAALAVAEQGARALVKALRLRELDDVAGLLGPAAERSLALQFALGESAWQHNDARAAAARFERAWALLDAAQPSAAGLLIAASALGVIMEGWQDFADTDTWAARLKQQLAARERIPDADDGLRVDSACLRANNMIWGGTLDDYTPLVARTLDALRGNRGLDPNEAVSTSSVLLEAAGYRLSDGNLFREVVAATAGWLQRPGLAPLAQAGWLVTYAPLGRRWPTPGVPLPAADPVACLERAIEIGREHGGHNVAFSAALFLAHMAVAIGDRVAAPARLAALREFVDPAHPRQLINVLEVESNVLALGGDWPGAQAVLRRARELAEANAFPSSQLWNMQVYEQRLVIAAGAPAQAREALLRQAAGYPAGPRREFALVLADVAAAAQAEREQGRIPPELVRAVMERARAFDWPGFTLHLSPLSARLCSEALRLGIEPEFARRVVRDRHLAPPSPHAPHWPWPVRVRALGTLAVEIDGEPLAFGPRAQRKPLDLLMLLVAQGPAPVDAAVVLDALWPDADGAAARAAFDMAVMRLRKLLGHPQALRLEAGRIGFDPQTVWVDAFAFEAGASDEYPGALFGADAVQPWWAAARERLHQRFLRHTLERARTRGPGRHRARARPVRGGAGAGPPGRGLLSGRDPLPPGGRPQRRRAAGVPPLSRPAVDRARRPAVGGHLAVGGGAGRPLTSLVRSRSLAGGAGPALGIR